MIRQSLDYYLCSCHLNSHFYFLFSEVFALPGRQSMTLEPPLLMSFAFSFFVFQNFCSEGGAAAGSGGGCSEGAGTAAISAGFAGGVPS
mmetsp:Transcript_11415/g.17623  ORF Transcript_11415/g.17623 Transcript_11415/m.17623 type:complete len:89 (-) Transcript_11415:35-301(-)